MSLSRPLARAGLITICALSLAGCISLFPKSKPSQLYRFDGSAAVETQAQTPAVRVGVVRTRGGFNVGAASDRIMTVSGSQVTYLAQARWAEPAVTMFDEAVTRAFGKAAGPTRLAARGEPGRAPYALRLDVERFEAAYDHGEKAPPEVRVEVHMTLVRATDRKVVADLPIAARARAADNRIGAIVQAFDQATGEVLAKVVATTNETATPID